MADQREIHVESDEARGGSTPKIVRYVLIISTLLAIVLLSAIWIFGAASQGPVESEVNVSERMEAADDGLSTDGIVNPEANGGTAPLGSNPDDAAVEPADVAVDPASLPAPAADNEPSQTE